MPGIEIPFLDKILHLCEYMIFGFLAARAFKNSSNKILVKNFNMASISLAILYGMSDEFHQMFVPLRQFSIGDLITDGLGGLLGVFIYCKYNSVQRRTL